MKYLLIFLGCLWSIFPSLQAQTIEKITISQGSETFNAIGGRYVSVTIGESVIGSLTSVHGTLSVGFKKGKEKDQSGEISYGEGVSLSEEMQGHLLGKVFPNPTAGITKFHYQGSIDAGEVYFILFDNVGRTIWRMQKNASELQSDIKLPLPNLPPGMYWLRIQNHAKIQSIKIQAL